MSQVEITDALLVKLGGWQAIKAARAVVAAGRVLSSEWQPPHLRGVVRVGTSTLRSGLVIKSASDADNLCPCRDSRERCLICDHSLAVGLHFIMAQPPPPAVKQKPGNETTVQKSVPKKILRAQAGGTGEALELCVILPPNFAEANGREKIMLCLEGLWHKGRVPLSTLPLDVPFQMSARDSSLLETVEALNNGHTPAMLMLNQAQFATVLAKMAGNDRVTLGRTQAVEIVEEAAQFSLRANLESNGEIVIRARNPFTATLVRGETSWGFDGKTFRPLAIPAGWGEVIGGPVRIGRARAPQFMNLDWPRLVASGGFEADFNAEDFEFEPAIPNFKLHLAGGLAGLQARLECFYAGQKAGGAPMESDWLPDAQSPTRYFARNFTAEKDALARLLKMGFAGPDAQGFYNLKGQDQVLSFFAREFPRLEKEWEVTLEERLELSTRKNLERIEPQFNITPSGEEWFNMSVAYDTRGGERFSNADIQRLLRSGQSHTRLKNGKFGLLDTGAVEEFQEILVDCAPEQNAGGYRMAAMQAGFLEATLRQQPGWKIEAPAAWSQRTGKLQGKVELAPPVLGELEATLRPYQKQGVAWLAFLRDNGFGGILADEMGLGKTLQVLALLDSVKTAGKTTAPSLVVCPTSLVFNWCAEAAQFTPRLKVLPVQGSQRGELFGRISSHDLVVTSYALLRRDAEFYRSTEFDTVILDEAQHIKNRSTQNAQAVKSIRSRRRLVLTGTPLENSVLDLWSIFDFLMPGYLGSARDFKDRYEQPIARDKNPAVQNRLSRRLRPFLLRRLKREVARDLPDKIEQVGFCELNEGQRALYQQMLEASRREIDTAHATGGVAKSRMVMLTALLRLRQICCDPRLLKLEPAVPGGEGKQADSIDPAGSRVSLSGKVELFNELLEEALDGGHRLLVFSQFTTMLGLLREQLTGEGIAYCYLDGSTRDRAAVVEKFQRDPAIPVFLISLKAGGVGLNLTGADTVIHFDPWWNPAVEAQATDRAHRIGQKRVVTSYKLITRGTVEEKILNLQNRKRALFETMLGGEDAMVSGLDWSEIQELLRD